MTFSQSDFFDHLKQLSPPYQNIAQHIADILKISTNESYKKIRGKSALSFAQLIELCDAFKVPFSYDPNGSGYISFKQPIFSSSEFDVKLYLQELLTNITTVGKLNSKHIYLTTDDIPLFHFFKFPELTCFKLFFWTDSLKSSKDKFDKDYIKDDVIAITTQISKAYLEIPSTEIWSKDTVHGTIEQIRYAVEAGYLQDTQLAVTILEQLKNCLADINSYAIEGRKSNNEKHTFNWYCCDVLGSISYLVESPTGMTCYNRFNTFGYLKTDNPHYSLQTKEWMNQLRRKSVSYSGHGEKDRNRYLNISNREIDQLIDEVTSNSWK